MCWLKDLGVSHYDNIAFADLGLLSMLSVAAVKDTSVILFASAGSLLE